MIKILLVLSALFFTSCVNTRGVTPKYYSDCKEYYDLQGYYHKDCDEEYMLTYKKVKDTGKKVVKKAVSFLKNEEKKEVSKPNVW